MGDIRMYVFYESSNQQTHTNAQDVWFNIAKDYPNAEYIYGIDVNQGNDVPAMLSNFNVTKVPSVVFVELTGPDTGKTIARIEGSASYNKIEEVYKDVLNGVYGSGSGSGDSDAVIVGDDEDTSYGFGLTNWTMKSIWPLLIFGGLVYYSLRKKQKNG